MVSKEQVRLRGRKSGDTVPLRLEILSRAFVCRDILEPPGKAGRKAGAGPSSQTHATTTGTTVQCTLVQSSKNLCGCMKKRADFQYNFEH